MFVQDQSGLLQVHSHFGGCTQNKRQRKGEISPGLPLFVPQFQPSTTARSGPSHLQTGINRRILIYSSFFFFFHCDKMMWPSQPRLKNKFVAHELADGALKSCIAIKRATTRSSLIACLHPSALPKCNDPKIKSGLVSLQHAAQKVSMSLLTHKTPRLTFQKDQPSPTSPPITPIPPPPPQRPRLAQRRHPLHPSHINNPHSPEPPLLPPLINPPLHLHTSLFPLPDLLPTPPPNLHLHNPQPPIPLNPSTHPHSLTPLPSPTSSPNLNPLNPTNPFSPKTPSQTPAPPSNSPNPTSTLTNLTPSLCHPAHPANTALAADRPDENQVTNENSLVWKGRRRDSR